MDFNLNSLKIFIKLAELKNFTATAKQLGMTQPGVSQHIKSLEIYFKTKLLNRFGKNFELTPEGERVLVYSQNLFDQHELFKEDLKHDTKFEGLCKMAAPGGIGIKLYGLLLNLNKKYPRLSQSFHYAPNKSIEQQLLTNQIDIGFMSINPSSDLLQAQKITTEELLLLVPKKTKIKTYDDLIKLGFIDHPDGRDMITKLLSSNFKKEFKGFESLPIHGANNQINRILEPVAMGLGFTVLPHFALENFEDKNKIQTINLKKKVTNSIYIVRKKERPLPKRYQLIQDYLQDRLISD